MTHRCHRADVVATGARRGVMAVHYAARNANAVRHTVEPYADTAIYCSTPAKAPPAERRGAFCGR